MSDMPVGKPIKVAILGGGVGSMTAAYWLTRPSADPFAPRYDVTVYQLGWRIGGKGATGRNVQELYGRRIEEHGLHIWFGFYANAFTMMREVYDELGRPPGHALRTLNDAFIPQNVVTAESKTLFGFRPWVVGFPPNDRPLGTADRLQPIHVYIQLIAAHLRKFADEVQPILKWIAEHPLDFAVDVAEALAGLALLVAELEKLHHEAQAAEEGDSHAAVTAHAKHSHQLLDQLIASLAPVQDILRVLYLIDIGLAMLRGMIDDRVWERGWDSIDDVEWRVWLLKNGLHEQTRWCPYVRAVYDLVFAYRDGIADYEHADLAAGTASDGVLRMCFEYAGSVMWKMAAGMGETVFTPLYQVLKQRGVKFEFFHRVREVKPAERKLFQFGHHDDHIEHIRIGVQARTKDGKEYKPLVEVAGLECWPAQPHYDQLVHGELMKQGRIDLEDYNAPWPDAEEKILRAGEDFDWCVFGLSIGAVPYVCKGIVEQSEKWKAMVEHVKTVRTQALQLWCHRTVKEMGWPPANDGTDQGEPPVMGAFHEPMDTWADMSQLIPRETWPPSADVRSINYWCGPATRDTDVWKTADDLLRFDGHWIWPAAYDDIHRFRWEWLVDPEGREGSDRLAAQYFRINVQPTELYVLTVHGSTRYRLSETGYRNMVIVGDWVRSSLPLGCVEGAVIGAMTGLEPLLGRLPIIKNS